MLVSVCMITFKHEAFIREAIEGVLSQQADFEIQLVIGEDNGPDNTRQICAEYAGRFPGKVILISEGNNVGMLANFMRTYRACTGKYVAFCEGDDCWTDPLKLQKQIRFLEANPSFSLCFHNVILKYARNNSSGERVFHHSLEKSEFDTEDLLGPWFIPSGSVVFVNHPDLTIPDWFYHCKSGDIPFLLLISLHGRIKYLDEVMGLYRLHDGGVSVSHVSYDKIIAMIFIYESFNIHTKYRFKQKVKEAMIYEINAHMPIRDQEGNLTRSPNMVKKMMAKVKYLMTPGRGDVQ